jgi:phosphoribosylpyrophosphate synthetase
MTKLSPVAASIVQAFDDRYEINSMFNENWQEDCIAAALRAIDEELASCLFVGPDEGDVKRVIDVSDLHDLIAELEAQ